MAGLGVSAGQKFAIIAMPIGWIDSALSDENVHGSVRILRTLEVPVSEFWEENLGALRVNDVREADLYWFQRSTRKSRTFWTAKTHIFSILFGGTTTVC